jgi:hypothetical protein
MSFLVYFFVLLVAASSVLFGLDWMQAPLQAPPYAERTTHAVAPPAAPPPARKVAQTEPAGPVAVSAPDAAAPVAEVPAGAAARDGVSATDATGALGAQANEPKASCDIAACERAYHSFTRSDCTYQPFSGPRRLCTRGHPAGGRAALLAANEARAQAGCNVSACASAYASFDPATCTYQPYDGPRRLCTK